MSTTRRLTAYTRSTTLPPARPRLTPDAARAANFSPLTTAYYENEESLLERALAPLDRDRIPYVLVVPTKHHRWPVEIWRKGLAAAESPRVIPAQGEGLTHRAPKPFRDWVVAEYKLKPLNMQDKAWTAGIHARWRKWRNGNQTCAVPGYDACPPPSARTEAHPQGWSHHALIVIGRQIKR